MTLTRNDLLYLLSTVITFLFTKNKSGFVLFILLDCQTLVLNQTSWLSALHLIYVCYTPAQQRSKREKPAQLHAAGHRLPLLSGIS